MGQASPNEKKWCSNCTCNGKPAALDAPIQVIHEALPDDAGGKSDKQANVQVAVQVLYSPKGGYSNAPQASAQSRPNSEPTAEPEPVPPLLDAQPARETSPKHAYA